MRAGTDFPTFKCKTCPCKTGKLKLKVYEPVLTKQQHWSQEDLCQQCWHSSIDTSSLPTRQWTFRLVYEHFKNKGNSLSLNILSCSPANYCKQVSPWITDYNWQRFKTKEIISQSKKNFYLVGNTVLLTALLIGLHETFYPDLRVDPNLN